MLLQMALFHFFVANIPLYVCTTTSLPSSSVSGYLDCFHALAIVNSTAVIIVVHVFFFDIWFSLDICVSAELLDHMAALFLDFGEKGTLLPCSWA